MIIASSSCEITVTMALNTSQRAPAPRRTGFVIFSIVSLLVLGIFLASNARGTVEKHGFAFERNTRAKSSSSSNARAEASGDKYLIGVGKGDITGPTGMQLCLFYSLDHCHHHIWGSILCVMLPKVITASFHIAHRRKFGSYSFKRLPC